MTFSREHEGSHAAWRGRLLPMVGVAAVLVFAASAMAGGVRRGSRGASAGDIRTPVQEVDELTFHVLNRLTYGPTPESLAEIRAIGVDEFTRRQLNPDEIDDSFVEARLAGDIPAPDAVFYQWNEFYYEHLLRARYSNRQLQEIMVQFWENHFTTVVVRGNNDDERHFWTEMEWSENAAFRENAFGRFRDLLEASAKSQAMMYFLDNYRSSIIELNENYGREIMELHSLGVDCGYDDTDVTEVSRIFTGWTGVGLPGPPPVPGRDEIEGSFLFRAAAHDAFRKTALGYEFPSGGMMDEGMLLLDILSSHPCTARFISEKLIKVFVTDFPSTEYVDRIAAVFLTTDGDIKRVLEAIFASPEFRDPVNFVSKVRTPIEFTIAAQRGLDAWVGPRRDGRGGIRDTWNYVRLQGMDLFDYPIPEGYDEEAGDWVNANSFLWRWKYAYSLAWWFDGDSRSVYHEPMDTIANLGLTTADAVIDHHVAMLLGTEVSSTRRALLRDTLTGGTGVFDPTDGGQENRLREMISYLLGSPEFIKQ